VPQLISPINSYCGKPPSILWDSVKHVLSWNMLMDEQDSEQIHKYGFCIMLSCMSTTREMLMTYTDFWPKQVIEEERYSEKNMVGCQTAVQLLPNASRSIFPWCSHIEVDAW